MDLSDMKTESLRTDVGNYPPELWQDPHADYQYFKKSNTEMKMTIIPKNFY